MLRGIGVTALGVVLGLVSGAIAGLGYAMGYHPHGGGPVGDWGGIIVMIDTAFGGVVVGLIAGIAWAATDRPLWQLAAGFGVLAVALGVLLFAVAA